MWGTSYKTIYNSYSPQHDNFQQPHFNRLAFPVSTGRRAVVPHPRVRPGGHIGFSRLQSPLLNPDEKTVQPNRSMLYAASSLLVTSKFLASSRRGLAPPPSQPVLGGPLSLVLRQRATNKSFQPTKSSSSCRSPPARSTCMLGCVGTLWVPQLPRYRRYLGSS